MAWGGSLNKKGSNHIRILREADKVIKFLETIKDELNLADQMALTKTIEIITDYIFRISEEKNS
jgi:hypothetical protein